MKHCTTCHKDEPEVTFYEYKNTICKECCKQQSRDYRHGSGLSREILKALGINAQERHLNWLKREEETANYLKDEITRIENKLIQQAIKSRGSVGPVNIYPLFAATYSYLSHFNKNY